MNRDDPPSPPPAPDDADKAKTVVAKNLRKNPEASPSSDPGWTPPPSSVVPAASEIPVDPSFNERYLLREVLGVGGSGQVFLCSDRRIGREVALKVLLPEWDALQPLRQRFIREAQIQGQLEHPAMVPVHDLAAMPDGATFFTMKRIHGQTLLEILRGLRARNPAFARYTRRKLLSAFSSVCLAVDFAHSRGIIHRDLKPGNLMLGDFGEVNVLDWGLAKRVGGPASLSGLQPRRSVAVPAPGAPDAGDSESDGAPTLQGAVMGTPGYMSPEQARGDVAQLDARTDVYALGAILVELLTLRPLHAGADPEAIEAATLAGADVRAQMRAAEVEVPPELEALCARATASNPADRFASARELSDQLERFLDGDRDVERRQELARQHAERADAILLRALEHGPDELSARADALKEATRALAMDPANESAMSTLRRLLVEPPGEVPPEVLSELEGTNVRSRRRMIGLGAISYLSWFAFAPLFFWMGVRSVQLTFVVSALAFATTAWATWLWRTGRVTDVNGFVLFLLSSATISSVSWALGPFVVVPALAVINTLFYVLLANRGVLRRVLLGLSMLIVLLPFALELLGIVPQSYGFAPGQLIVHSRGVDLRPTPTLTFLAVVNGLLVILPSLAIVPLRDALRRAELRLLTHSWHLNQLIGGAPTRLASKPAVANG